MKLVGVLRLPERMNPKTRPVSRDAHVENPRNQPRFPSSFRRAGKVRKNNGLSSPNNATRNTRMVEIVVKYST